MNNNSFCRCYVPLTVFFAVIVGIAFALLYLNGYFPDITVTLYIALGVAALFLISQIIYGLLYAACAIRRKIPPCLVPLAVLNVAGTAVTIGAAMLALVTHLVPAALSAVVLSSICAFSFALMMGSFVLMFYHLFKKTNYSED